MPKVLSGIQEIIGQYKLAIIDQWGVLHNGIVPYDGAIEAISALHQSGTKIIILSNSGKVANHSVKLIARMGFDMAHIHKVISSGEAAHQWLSVTKDIGKKLIFWGFDNDYTAIENLGLERVDNIASADFIVAAGAGRGSVAAYQEEMDIGLQRSIPMLCTNPDLVATVPDGSLKICPGSLAVYYESKGGRVIRFGKPAKEVYDMCFQEFPDIVPDKKSVIGIGDSLDHDVMGAERSRIASLFITDGIHLADFKHGIDKLRTEKLFQHHGVTPDFMLDSFHL